MHRIPQSIPLPEIIGFSMTVEQRLRNLHLEASRWFSWKQGGDFPGGSVVKNLPANAGDTGSIPGPGDYHVLQSIQARVPQLWASALLPRNPSSWSLCPGTREATKMRSLCTTVNNNSHSPKLERSLNSSEDPPQPKKRERERKAWAVNLTTRPGTEKEWAETLWVGNC